MKKLTVSRLNALEPFLWVYFIWYYFPVARAFFKSTTYNTIFFGILICGCALCVVQILARAQKISVGFSPLIPVLVYFLVFTVLTVFHVATADRHIRVSFTFWGTLIIYYLTNRFPDIQRRLGKLMLVMFLVTTVTSVIGVVINPYAARLLTYAENDIAEDIVIRLLNIGGLAFFQGLVIIVPILIAFLSQHKYRVFCIILLLLIFLGLISASFTISIVMFFVALLLGYLSNKASKSKVFISLCLLIIVFVVPWERVLISIADSINNDHIQERLLSIAKSLSSGVAEGNLESRMELYGASLDTFLRHPFGVGPEYTFVNYQMGIGYHSQFLDDLARYGIFAIAFYIAFFKGYYQLLRKQWDKVNMKQVAWPVTVIYFCFLVVNPGFTSAHEGVLLLFLIPVLPNLLEKTEQNENCIK